MDKKITNITNSIICIIKKTINKTEAVLHEPIIDEEDLISVAQTLKSGYVSSVGQSIKKFEKNLSEYTKTNYAVAMSSGTSALHIALLINGVSPNDEILLPALTFVATANSILYCNAIPHFIDSNIENLGIDNKKLLDYLKKNTTMQNNQCINKNTGRVISAIMPVHVFGFIGDMISLKKITDEFKISIIEDSTEALGSFKNNQHAGTFGKCGCISFNGNKIITTGGGGALITNDFELAEKARHLSTTAKIAHQFEYKHDQIGYNYRMPAINAALGLSQLKKINIFLKNKEKLRNNYIKNFNDIEGLVFFKGPRDCNSNYWLNSIILDNNVCQFQNDILKKLNDFGFGCRPIWYLLNKLPPFLKYPCMDLSNAEKLQRSIINLPSSANLGLPNA